MWNHWAYNTKALAKNYHTLSDSQKWELIDSIKKVIRDTLARKTHIELDAPQKAEIEKKIMKEINVALNVMDFQTIAFSSRFQWVIQSHIPKSEYKRGVVNHYAQGATLAAQDKDKEPKPLSREEELEQIAAKIKAYKIKATEFWNAKEYAKAFVLYRKARDLKSDDMLCKDRMSQIKNMKIEPTKMDEAFALRSMTS